MTDGLPDGRQRVKEVNSFIRCLFFVPGYAYLLNFYYLVVQVKTAFAGEGGILMTCDLTLYQYSSEQAARIGAALDRFNKGRSAQNGHYAVSLPTAYRPYCGFWRVFPDGMLVYVRTLAMGVETALERAMQMLQYCNVWLEIEAPSLFEGVYGRSDDVMTFGKYRGKRMAEIYYVDPAYVMWLAHKYTPDSRRNEQLVVLAKYFVKINFELTVPKRKISSVSSYVGEVGEKLKDLSLVVLNVRLQVDFYKPDFYVDQNVLAADRDGNRFTFLVKAAGLSLTPKVLNCRSRKIQLQEELLLKSAKVMRHYEHNGVCYTKLGYVKW